MTVQQLKLEIQNSLDEVPESALQNILEYLKEVKLRSKGDVELSRHLNTILKEDQKLLERLAQ